VHWSTVARHSVKDNMGLLQGKRVLHWPTYSLFCLRNTYSVLSSHSQASGAGDSTPSAAYLTTNTTIRVLGFISIRSHWHSKSGRFAIHDYVRVAALRGRRLAASRGADLAT
jgi:hypothetical protein